MYFQLNTAHNIRIFSSLLGFTSNDRRQIPLLTDTYLLTFFHVAVTISKNFKLLDKKFITKMLSPKCLKILLSNLGTNLE